ncbi:MAG: ATP-binding protein [Candidatus Saganbacteria bacterium]|nr:ATP-binding protein [Candidatus Saganbacteria bacterium]
MGEVSAARQLKAIAREADRQALAYGQKIRAQFGKLPVKEQIQGLAQLVKEYKKGVYGVEGRLFELYRENYAGRQKPGELDWQSIMLDLVNHDLAHLRDHISGQLAYGAKKRGSEPIDFKIQQAVGELVKRSGEYLVFANYPLRIIATLAAQQECLAPAYAHFSLEKMFELIALSGFFRSLVEGTWNTNFQVGTYSKEKAADPAYAGILTHLEPGLKLKTIEPYVVSIFYNLIKNAFKIMLWDPDGEPVPGAKVVVSALTHPTYPSVAVVEVIDNGPGFDLRTISQQALRIKTSSPGSVGLSAEIQDAIERLNGSPYAYSIDVNELMRLVFLYRLTASAGGGLGSGLGLYGANQLSTQLHGSYVVGMNHQKTEPFTTGARFMFFLPKDPYAFMPDLSLLTKDVQYGALETPIFRG